jgi:hypothetical protein
LDFEGKLTYHGEGTFKVYLNDHKIDIKAYDSYTELTGYKGSEQSRPFPENSDLMSLTSINKKPIPEIIHFVIF